MSKGITEKEPDPEIVYADIFRHPHWQSPARPSMSLYDRAAQFAPFAALTGYEDMIGEEARITDRRIEPGEAEADALNETLARLQAALRKGEKPTVSITRFVPDPLKAGGKYETITDAVKRIDTVRGRIVLVRTEGYGDRNIEISLPDILEIRDSP